MAGNYLELMVLLEMTGYSWKWMKMAKTKIAGNDWNWLEIAGWAENGWKWMEMNGNGWKWL